MTTYKLRPILVSLGACQEALDWVEQSGYKTFKEAWEAAPAYHRWQWWVLHQLAKYSYFEKKARLLIQEAERQWELTRRGTGGNAASSMDEADKKFVTQEHARLVVEEMLIEFALRNDCAVEEK